MNCSYNALYDKSDVFDFVLVYLIPLLDCLPAFFGNRGEGMAKMNLLIIY